MTTISVFQNTPQSYQELLELFYDLSLYNSEVSGQGEKWFSSNWQSRREKELNRYLSSPDAIIHVAQSDGHLVGYSITYVCPAGGFCTFEELYIKPEYRNQGVGSEFFQIRKAWCQQFGYPIKLEVYDWNKNAIAFHQKNQFKFDSYVYVLDNKI